MNKTTYYRKREILGAQPKKKQIRKRKTEPKEGPLQHPAGWLEHSEWKDECADAVGKVRLKRSLVPPKSLSAHNVIKKINRAVQSQTRTEIRMQKRLKHALNSGERLRIKTLKKEKSLKAANGLI